MRDRNCVWFPNASFHLQMRSYCGGWRFEPCASPISFYESPSFTTYSTITDAMVSYICPVSIAPSQITPARERYASGTKLSIQTHIPPEPFGPNHQEASPEVNVEHRHHRLQFAVDNPPFDPSPWETLEDIDRDEEMLVIERYVEQKEDGGSTVVECHLQKDPSVQYIAKIYDAVDYPDPTQENEEDEGMDAGTGVDNKDGQAGDGDSKSGDQESGTGVIGVGMGVIFLSALVSLLNL